CLGQPVFNLNILSAQLAEKLHVVVARHTKGAGGFDQMHDCPAHVWNIGSAIDEIADEHGLSTRRANPLGALRIEGFTTQLFQKERQFGMAAVDVSNDIKRSAVMSPIDSKWFHDHGGAIQFLITL